MIVFKHFIDLFTLNDDFLVSSVVYQAHTLSKQIYFRFIRKIYILELGYNLFLGELCRRAMHNIRRIF